MQFLARLERSTAVAQIPTTTLLAKLPVQNHRILTACRLIRRITLMWFWQRRINMRDHKNRGKRFCPILAELCTKGWTPKMGLGPDGFPQEGLCAAWQPVSLFEIATGKEEEVFDCSAFGWPTDQRDTGLNILAQTHQGVQKVRQEIEKAQSQPLQIEMIPPPPPPRLSLNGNKPD
jgi:hypothetical protein